MKTDRELLELAARAAGIVPAGYGHKGIARGRNGSCLINYWNPLTDDGDALRLAVGLKIRIEPHIRWPYVAAFVDNILARFEEPTDVHDAYAATRRAIVRAAAAIGDGMK